MPVSFDAIMQYCEQHSSPPSALLYELERETHLKTLAPQMMSDGLQGAFVSMLCAIAQPQHILEIGTFTGYAAINMAQHLSPNGHLHTIEVNEELAHIIQKYIQKAGLEKQITLHLGDAKAIIPTIDQEFDLIFIDAGKHHYAQYYELVFDKLRHGGLILADNVLWNGKVVEARQDADTQMLQQFNEMVLNDERVENVLLPIRDGLVLVRKR